MTPGSIAGDWPEWRSLGEWQRDAHAVQREELAAVEVLGHSGRLTGKCGLCAAHAGFKLGAAGDDLREGLQCLACGCNPRQRAAAALLLAALPVHGSQARVYATEQASPLFVALRRRIPGLIGSEHRLGLFLRIRLTLWLWRHGVPGPLSEQDVTALHFRDAILDAVISLDVLEHVFDFNAALRELARVLRSDGVLVLTVPFYSNEDETATIARLADDGSIEHDGVPEFHGNPLGRGVVCFHHFGWDLLDALRAAGFSDAFATRVKARAGGLPAGQWVLCARR